MKILFENDNIIFCVKPDGVLSQADDVGRDNMICRLENYCGCKIYPVHRLDREVSGVMVYAKNKEYAAKISVVASDHECFKKEYLAIVQGVPPQYGIFEDLLYHDRAKNKTYTVKRQRNGVKKAKLEYTVLESVAVDGNEYSLVKIRLFTGRTHQIRVQFSSRGFPLLGDRRYGGIAFENTIHLFSHKLELSLPNEKLSFGEIPENIGGWLLFEKALNSL